MTDKGEKKSDIRLNYKAILIIAIILVSTQIIGISGGYEYLGVTFQEIPVSMIEPSMSIQCQKAITEYNDFKEFLGVAARVDLLVRRDGVFQVAEQHIQLLGELRDLGGHLGIARREEVDHARGAEGDLS